MKKTHIGSTLDDFLQEDCLLEATAATATKRFIAHQIATEMKRLRLTKTATARRMKTSRAAKDWLLDPSNPSVTIGTLERAAPPEAHESLISRKTGAEVPLTGLSFSLNDGQHRG